MEKKRDRATNFQKSEVNLLTELVTKYRSILENKKTDTVTNKNKEAAWTNIASIFNSISNGTFRSSKTLKLKYESLKKNVKKKLTCHRQEYFKTGGGPSNAPDLNEDEAKFIGISTNILGLDPRNDSDNITDCHIEIFKNDEVKIEYVQENTTTATDNHIEMIKNDDTTVRDGTADLKLTNPTPEAVNDKNDDTIDIIDSTNKWETWSPKSLKSKISKELKPKKATQHTVTEKLDELSAARLELVKLQQRIAESEHLFKKEEHELKMSNLRNEENRKAELHQLMLSSIKRSHLKYYM